MGNTIKREADIGSFKILPLDIIIHIFNNIGDYNVFRSYRYLCNFMQCSYGSKLLIKSILPKLSINFNLVIDAYAKSKEIISEIVMKNIKPTVHDTPSLLIYLHPSYKWIYTDIFQEDTFEFHNNFSQTNKNISDFHPYIRINYHVKYSENNIPVIKNIIPYESEWRKEYCAASRIRYRLVNDMPFSTEALYLKFAHVIYYQIRYDTTNEFGDYCIRFAPVMFDMNNK